MFTTGTTQAPGACCRGLTALLMLLLSFAAQAKWYSHEFEVMGTRASVELWLTDGEARAQQLFADVEQEMQRIDALLSHYRDDSVVSRINRLGAQQWLVLDEEVYQLLASAQHYAQLSDGAFDISYAAVGELYDFRAGEQPGAEQLDARLPQIDYRNLQLDSARLAMAFSHAGMRIDLGGIAKGYAVDRSIALLKDSGVTSALVSAGGDSRMLGDRGPAMDEHARGARLPWMIGIRHPREPGQQALRLPLADVAISTSGDYERFFMNDGARVHHIINPQTGRSASGLVSATIIGPRSQDCDALSTTVFVLGAKKGLALVESLDGYDAVLIDTDGGVHYSSGLGSE